MSLIKWQLGFFLVLIALGVYLSYRTIQPFWGSLFIAVILSVIFYPLHKKILKYFKGDRWISAMVSVFLVVIVVLLPIGFLGFLLFQESTELYTEIKSGVGPVGILETLVSNIQGFLNAYLPYNIDIKSYVDAGRYSGSVVSWLAENSSIFVSSLISGALNLFLLILAMFYIFKDGKELVYKIVEISPLKDEHDNTILDKVHLAVNSVIRGHIIISIIQGFLAGLGFWIFGVPSPVIWGFIAAIASFIPTLGTSLVILPVVLFLLFAGQVASAIGLIVWGVLIVGLVDNIIGPKLIERGVKIHPFLILIFVLGGIQVFGPIGFIVGPILLSMLFALLEIYPLMVGSKNE